MRVVEALHKKEDISAMLKRLDNPRDQLLFLFGISSALRIQDLLALKWSDVRPALTTRASEIYVVERKTGKNRVVVVNDFMRKLISSFHYAKDDDFIFKSRQRKKVKITEKTGVLGLGKKTREELVHGPITRQQAWKIINDAGYYAGLVDKDQMGRYVIGESIGPHTLRRTFGRLLYENGVPIERIAKHLNHSHPQITLEYIGITKKQMKADSEIVSDFLNDILPV